MNPKHFSLFLITIVLFLIAGVIYVQGAGYETRKIKCETFRYEGSNRTLIVNNTIINGVVNVTYQNGTLIYVKERRDATLNFLVFAPAIFAIITLVIFLEEVKK